VISSALLDNADDLPKQKLYRAHGGAAELFMCKDLEILCESGAGTGKTRSLLEHAYATALTYPGCVLFFARQTRKALVDSAMKIFEAEVISAQDRAKLTGTREHRDRYSIGPPGRESEIVMLSLEDIDRVMSAQFDKGYVFEATEVKGPDIWEKLLTRMRANSTDCNQLIADCNPGRYGHWLNQRAEKPYTIPLEMIGILPPPRPGQKLMTRIKFRHEDNPVLYDVDARKWTQRGAYYIGVVLNNLSGARKERLLYHKWTSEEGLIWATYNQSKHLLSGYTQLDTEGRLWLNILDQEWRATPRIRLVKVTAGLDFGHTAPGSLQVIGRDEKGRRFRIAEVYHSGKLLDWWAERIGDCIAQFGLSKVYADPSRNDDIKILNKWLRQPGRESWDMLVVGAKNRLATRGQGDLGGLDVVRTMFARDELYLLRNCNLGGVDPDLREARQPFSLEEEMEGYIWEKRTDGMRIKEVPMEGIPDHGCDAFRYDCFSDFTEKQAQASELERAAVPKPGTYAAMWGTPETLQNAAIQRSRLSKYGF
jgi:hypothetical protein